MKTMLKVDPKELSSKELFDCFIGANLAAGTWNNTVKALQLEIDRRNRKRERAKKARTK